MKVLGISAFYHDSAAALVIDGEIICAAHEERFSRIKHDDDFPARAIRYCLKEAGLEASELDAVVFYDKPFVKFERILETYFKEVPNGFVQFAKSLPVWTKDKLLLKRKIKKELLKTGDFENVKLQFTEHHYSHAASAFYPSPFEEATVLTIDGVGEWATTSIGLGKGNELKLLKEIHFPHSIGLFYSAFTQYCGFKVNSGEYKLMGLAPLGAPKYVELIKKNLIKQYSDGSFELNLKYFGFTRGFQMINRNFQRLLGRPPRKPDEPLTDFYKDIAASCQQVTEELVMNLAVYAVKLTGSRNLCMAGGVALNCVANGRLFKSGEFDAIWVQPASGDAGGSLGAALAAYYLQTHHTRIVKPADTMQNAYLGPQFSQQAIEKTLQKNGAVFTTLSQAALLDQVARYLAEGKVIGWFQGRMEFGPRALGNRSILANPAVEGMQKQLNLKTKFREDFRPFAPVVRKEELAEYFEPEVPGEYMLFTTRAAKGKYRSRLNAVVHADESARVQTLTKASNEKLYELLGLFRQHAGFGVLVNTSFNVRGEPMVCTPTDAWNCFMGSGIEVLAIGNCLLLKEEQTASTTNNWSLNFEAD